MALASWRDMVGTILAFKNCVDADRRRCGATISFTSIYDACKSAKGVVSNRNWSFTGFAWRFVRIPRCGISRSSKKEEAPAVPRPLVKAQWTISSDQRHQL